MKNLLEKPEFKDVKNLIIETMEANMKWSTERQTEIKNYLCSRYKTHKECNRSASLFANISIIGCALFGIFILKLYQ